MGTDSSSMMNVQCIRENLNHSITQIDFPGEVFTLGNSRFYANGILVY